MIPPAPRRLCQALAFAAAAAGGTGTARAGTIPITLVVPALAQITGLSDVVFSNIGVATDAVNAQSVCVFSNGASHAYAVVATGSGAGSAFTLKTAAGAVIPYIVGWSGSAGAVTTTSLTSGTTSSSFSGAANALACAGVSATATLQITIAAASLQAMIAGQAYTGTLTLVITPG